MLGLLGIVRVVVAKRDADWVVHSVRWTLYGVHRMLLGGSFLLPLVCVRTLHCSSLGVAVVPALSACHMFMCHMTHMDACWPRRLVQAVTSRSGDQGLEDDAQCASMLGISVFPRDSNP